MNSTKNIITLLIEHEESISKLYAGYAEKFPDYKQFWETVSSEEKDHAAYLQEIKDYIKKGQAVFDKSKFKEVIVQNSHHYVLEQLGKLKDRSMTLKNALSVAVNLENAVVDGAVFECFKGLTMEVRRRLRNMADAFINHYNKIKDFWSENRYLSDQ